VKCSAYGGVGEALKGEAPAVVLVLANNMKWNMRRKGGITSRAELIDSRGSDSQAEKPTRNLSPDQKSRKL
jgi:hypothetical protein